MSVALVLSVVTAVVGVTAVMGIDPPEAGSPRFSDEDFHRKASVDVVFEYRRDDNFREDRSVVGHRRFYVAQPGDTLLDVARFYGLGYNEIEEANRAVDPWLPDESESILLATEWVLPVAEHRGVIVNIPEMRLYHFLDDPTKAGRVVTYPVGLGRDEWRTPKGDFRIQGKTENPTWVIPESIRQERIREKGLDERSIAGGDPRNPLGKHRLELTMAGYRIHGTNQTYGVGMQVSHGCVRLYPEDIEKLFRDVKVGSPGAFLYQPVKVGARDGRIFVEVHRDIYTLLPGLHSEAVRLLGERGWAAFVDPAKLQQAVEAQSGVPFDVTAKAILDALPPGKGLPTAGRGQVPPAL